MSGIAAGSGLKGEIRIRQVQDDGQKTLTVLREVTLRPSGNRIMISKDTDFVTIELQGKATALAGSWDSATNIGYEMAI